MNLCFAEDDFTRSLEDDHRTALWQARLSDGSVVTMDDGRPGIEPPSAWIRLRDYLLETKLSIVGLWLKFRSNRDENILPANAQGYFFTKSIMSSLDPGSLPVFFYMVGYLVGDTLTVERWDMPALILVEREIRSLDGVEEQLIRNPPCEIGLKTP